MINISESIKENGAGKASAPKKPRIVWIDILRGIMMFFVVYGHCTVWKGMEKYIFTFHMPAFFFISGLSFSFNKETDPLKYLLKKLRTLMVPYVLLNLYVTPLYYVNVRTGANPDMPFYKLLLGMLVSNVDSELHMPSDTTWFIPCLFLTDMLFFAFRKLIKNDAQLVGAVLLTTCTMYSLGILTAKFKGGGPWHWQVTFTAVIFYMAGYFFMRNIDPIKKFVTENKLRILLICGVLFADGYMIHNLNRRVTMVSDRYHNTLFFYIAAFSTSLAWVFLVMLLSESGIFVKLMTPINFIGKNTLAYIALHVPIKKLLIHYTVLGKLGESYRLPMTLLIYFGLIPFAWLISKLLPGRSAKQKQ